MKGGSITDSPSNVGVPRPCVGIPFVVCPVALLNGGVACVVLSPCLCVALSLSYCSASFSSLCGVVFVVGGEVRWCLLRRTHYRIV